MMHKHRIGSGVLRAGYEDAVNLVARHNLDTVNYLCKVQREYCKEQDQAAVVTLQLQSAQKEVEDTGEISQELRSAYQIGAVANSFCDRAGNGLTLGCLLF